MLETGLGFIAANLIIIYGLLTGQLLQRVLHSVRSLGSFFQLSNSSHSGRNRAESLGSHEGKTWAGNGAELSTSAEFAAQKPKTEEELDAKWIRMTHMVQSTEERA